MADSEYVLLIDDDLCIRDLVSDYLEDNGYSVKHARDGNEGLEIFRAFPARVVITDIPLPGYDAFSLMRCLKRNNPQVKIIATTGGPNSLGLLSEAVQHGAAAILSKPFRLPDLLFLVTQFIKGQDS